MPTSGASHCAGAVILTMIVGTVRMRTHPSVPHCIASAPSQSSAVATTSVSRAGGAVIMIMTVGMAVMRSSAVSLFDH